MRRVRRRDTAGVDDHLCGRVRAERQQGQLQLRPRGPPADHGHGLIDRRVALLLRWRQRRAGFLRRRQRRAPAIQEVGLLDAPSAATDRMSPCRVAQKRGVCHGGTAGSAFGSFVSRLISEIGWSSRSPRIFASLCVRPVSAAVAARCRRDRERTRTSLALVPHTQSWQQQLHPQRHSPPDAEQVRSQEQENSPFSCARGQCWPSPGAAAHCSVPPLHI